jgi:hypothetical protein
MSKHEPLEAAYSDDHQSSPLCSCSVTQTAMRLCGRIAIANCRVFAGSLANDTRVAIADCVFGISMLHAPPCVGRTNTSAKTGSIPSSILMAGRTTVATKKKNVVRTVARTT